MWIEKILWKRRKVRKGLDFNGIFKQIYSIAQILTNVAIFTALFIFWEDGIVHNVSFLINFEAGSHLIPLKSNFESKQTVWIMPLKIRTNFEWKQKTREGRCVTHFDKTVSIDDCTGLPFGRNCPPASSASHGYAPGLQFHLKFKTDYHTDPEIEIKVVEGCSYSCQMCFR